MLELLILRILNLASLGYGYLIWQVALTTDTCKIKDTCLLYPLSYSRKCSIRTSY
ncbi:hypothetical protein WN943_021596 [Citrus x changshan-huyou]